MTPQQGDGELNKFCFDDDQGSSRWRANNDEVKQKLDPKQKQTLTENWSLSRLSPWIS